jgi:hypothetical protein
MTLSDFTKQPHGPFTLDCWTSNQAIPSPMGEFIVELQMGLGDNAPPDSEMLRRAEELVALFRANIEIIHDRVFEHYQMVTGNSGWLGDSGVPADLDRSGILEYLEVRTLTVSRDCDEDGPYMRRVYIIPTWDEEHGIYLAYRDGEFEFVDC